MWKSFKCGVGTGRSGYMGFAQVYENVLSYLLEEPGPECGTYYQLIERNSEVFDRTYAEILAAVLESKTARDGKRVTVASEIRLVEPRELLHLLNYIETNDNRLYYAPRPFYRSNMFCMSTLMQMGDAQMMACVFCGKSSSYYEGSDYIYFVTASDRTAGRSNAIRPTDPGSVSYALRPEELNGGLFSNDRDPSFHAIYVNLLSVRGDELHHLNCPIVWLHRDENATWNYKKASFTVRGVSKFHHLVRFLTTYPRPREDASWLCFTNKFRFCRVPGATKRTLENLFRIAYHERLRISAESFFGAHTPTTVQEPNDGESVLYDPTSCSASPEGPSREFYCEPMHVNAYVTEVVDPSDDPTRFGRAQVFQVGEVMATGYQPSGGSHAVVTPAGEQAVADLANGEKPYSTANGLFDRQREIGGRLPAADVASTLTGHALISLRYTRLRFLQGFLLRPLEKVSEKYVCMYCGVVFKNDLINYENAMTHYTPAQVDRLVKYALKGVTDKPMDRRVYGRHLLPVEGFQATFPTDLFSCTEPIRSKCNSHLRKSLIWYSASMDVLHVDDCVFRIKKRRFPTNECRVCLEVNDGTASARRRAMSCGHELCTSCYNEISITDCCLCKGGYRTDHLTVSDSVLEGYKQNGKIEGIPFTDV